MLNNSTKFFSKRDFKKNIRKNNSAMLQSHILLILIISVVMSFLLVFLLPQIYGKDHVKCLDVQFDIENLCMISETSVSFDLINNYNDSLKFNIDSKVLPNYFISGNSKSLIAINLDDSILKIFPIIIGDEVNYECRGKLKSRNTDVIKKC